MNIRELKELKKEIENLPDDVFNITTLKLFMATIVRAILDLEEYKNT